MPSSVPTRLTALDAFRGATMAFMVLVNNPGNGHFTYAPLQHAEWDGWTPTDVVFPSFVWIVGVAITLALGKRLEQGASKTTLLANAAKRALIIFALGLLVYAVPTFDPHTFRILGVLQRIAICYFITVAIYLYYTDWRGQLAAALALMAAYWALMMYVPVPGFGSGQLDEAHNFAHYIDKIILGAHNYHNTKTWDPEGIVSTLPSIASMLLGVMAGHLLARKITLPEKIKQMAIFGVTLFASAYLLNTWMPINKKLWSDSFVLLMAGLDFLMLAAFLTVADVWGKKDIFKPFVIIGLNPITVYLVSEFADTLFNMLGCRTAIYGFFTQFLAPLNASLLYALLYVGLMYAVAYILYKRGIFLRA